MSQFFGDIKPATYGGPDATDPFTFRHYNPDQIVAGKSLKDHLRFAVAYWHSFCWSGLDPFGDTSFDRDWYTGDMAGARLKADAAFEMFDILQAPYFCFHDRDVAPEGDTLAESNRNVREIAEVFARKMETSKTRLLWGTANMFSHRRFMSGAATNPDPDVFAYSAGQVKNVLEITHELGGENYVLWGGREGYETLLNTNIKQEMDQAGRFLNLVVEHKHKIGFKGAILIEPKPQEPSKHQYDFDVATVYGFLKAYGLENEVKVNLEQGHAILAGHSFEHELALAGALGIFGSIDINRNDYQSGWDTDQFPNNVPEVALAYYYVLRNGGFTTGGTNFDAKTRRQSPDAQDLIAAHIGGMDVCARALIAASKMIEDRALEGPLDERYAGWQTPEAQAMLNGDRSLADIAERVEKENINPTPRSGRQEILENIINRYV